MSAKKIHVLPELLVNRIAAGEVIERPASIVRELVENAIDAGAKKIFVHAEDGGNKIQVRDDGCGMIEADLESAVRRHATSKLPPDCDGSNILKYIESFGFRGEALASIAAVARLSITTRTAESEQGYQLKTNFGTKSKITPAAANKGTLVQIDDLFHALPARRKFLKSERYELSLITDVVKRLALAHPAIAFELSGTSARALLYPASLDLIQNAQAERVKQIMGKTFLDNAVLVLDDYRHNKISGWVSLPTYHRPNTSEQFLFVNGRPVRDRVLAGALRAAYADVIFRNRHPALLLFLDIPTLEVDINVHPAKSEVRFRDAAAVRLLTIGAIKKALATTGRHTATSHSDRTMAALEQSAHTMPAPAGGTPAGGAPSPQSGTLPAAAAPAPAPAALNDTMIHQLERERADPVPLTRAPMATAPPPPPLNNTKGKVQLGVPRGQLHNTYIVSQTEDAIIITDQHAAHERILHERLKAAALNNNVERLTLLVPEIIDLTAEQVELLMAHQENLHALGFTIEPYGAASLVLSEIPTLCRNADKTDLMRTLIDDFSQEGGGAAFETLLDQISGNIACRSAIRAGQPLSFTEMDSLLRRMARTPNAGSCNHGRPTYIELKLNNIEKLFHRR